MSAPQFVFFGDSLTDDGNLYNQAEGLLDDVFRDAASGYDGRASDGPTWAENLANRAGVTYDIYAVAGAEAVGSQSLVEFATSFGALDYALVPLNDPALQWDMNLAAQIDRFETDTAGMDLSASTGIIMIGGNDYGALRETLPALDPVQALAALADTLVSTVTATLTNALNLYQMGMDQVVVTSLPEAAFFPVINATGATISGLLGGVFDVHNDLLETGVDILAGLGADITFLDLGPITGAIADDASQFGMIAPYQLFTNTLSPSSPYEADQIAFWDDIHPSGQTHELTAQFILTASTTEVITGANTAETHDNTSNSAETLAFLMGGDDLYFGNAAQNTVFGGTGNDEIHTGASDDLLSGGAGANTLLGYEGDDILALGGSGSAGHGGAGDDLLILQQGTVNGLADGGTGNDIFVTGLGTGTLSGGAGDDIFLIYLDQSADMLTQLEQIDVQGGEGHDQVALLYDGPSLDLQYVANALQITLTNVEDIMMITDLGGLFDGIPDIVNSAADWGLLPDAWVYAG